MQKNKVVIICGATATGKSELALNIANNTRDSLIINADSMQVYEEIPIITSQPTQHHTALVQHRLYGIISVKEHFSVGRWLALANEIINDCFEKKLTPILVGGTGMYIESIVNGFSLIPTISETILRQIEDMPRSELKSILTRYDSVTAES